MAEGGETITLPNGLDTQSQGLAEIIVSEIRSEDSTARTSRYLELLFYFVGLFFLLWFVSILIYSKAKSGPEVEVTSMRAVQRVFLCGAVEGVLPLKPRSEDGSPLSIPEAVKEHYAEERRVYYVAITRAEERLWVTFPARRQVGAGVENCDPSRYTIEAGETLQYVDMTRKSNNQFRRRAAAQPSHYTPAIPDGGADAAMDDRSSRDPEVRRLEIERRRAVSPPEEE